MNQSSNKMVSVEKLWTHIIYSKWRFYTARSEDRSHAKPVHTISPTYLAWKSYFNSIWNRYYYFIIFYGLCYFEFHTYIKKYSYCCILILFYLFYNHNLNHLNFNLSQFLITNIMVKLCVRIYKTEIFTSIKLKYMIIW